MPRDSAHAPQLPLFVRDTVGYPEAISRYEAIRPVLKGQRSLRQQSEQTGINYWRLWRDLRRFRGDGLLVQKQGTLLAIGSPLFPPLSKGGAWKTPDAQRGLLGMH